MNFWLKEGMWAAGEVPGSEGKPPKPAPPRAFIPSINMPPHPIISPLPSKIC